MARRMKRYTKTAVDEWIARTTSGHLPMSRHVISALILNFCHQMVCVETCKWCLITLNQKAFLCWLGLLQCNIPSECSGVVKNVLSLPSLMDGNLLCSFRERRQSGSPLALRKQSCSLQDTGSLSCGQGFGSNGSFSTRGQLAHVCLVVEVKGAQPIDTRSVRLAAIGFLVPGTKREVGWGCDRKVKVGRDCGPSR